MSHNLTVPSSPPEVASVCPSGLKATETVIVCPRSIRWAVGRKSQSRTVRSYHPVAKVRPSGLKASESTLKFCP
jgi:hypothetical protein